MKTDNLALWLDLPSGWESEKSLLTYPNPSKAVSSEARKIEIEVRTPADAALGSVEIPAYALYYICEDANGTCLYRRQDFKLHVKIQGVNGRRLRDGG